MGGLVWKLHMARATLIINKSSRNSESELSAGLELLRSRDVQIVRMIRTADPDEVAEIIRECADSVDRVILGGGDGTMNHAAEAILESGLSLGILPLGTANDLARTLGIPPSIEGACEVIADGKIRMIDLGRVNGRLFFNVAHIGLGAEVTHRIGREDKKRWGALAYVGVLLTVLRENRSFRARIELDGRERDSRVIEIAIGNGRYYAGGLTVSEEAEIEDGELHLYLVKPRTLWRMVPALPSFRKGKAEREWIRYLKGKRISVKTNRRLPVSVDGELVTRTPALFEVLAGALPVFVPARKEEAP
ncbi:MAG: lipid kinase [Desulfobacteraceae bacterium]|nr:MAG: lipid kinase [Desulfobacteraceae bacterium]